MLAEPTLRRTNRRSACPLGVPRAFMTTLGRSALRNTVCLKTTSEHDGQCISMRARNAALRLLVRRPRRTERPDLRAQGAIAGSRYQSRSYVDQER